MENHSKYGGTIYAHTKDELLVNLFIASTLNWKEKGLMLTQENRFPDVDRTTLRIKVTKPLTLTLKIRYPSWVAANALRISINGKSIPVTAKQDSYVSINRTWRNGDNVVVTLPMQTTMSQLPDHSGFAAIMRGPIVLAAKTGTQDETGEFADTGRFAHIARGPLYPLAEAPMLVGQKDSILAEIIPEGKDSMKFTASRAIYPAKYRDLELIPFFRIGGSRYMMYWQETTAQNLDQVVSDDEKMDQKKKFGN